MAKNLWGDLSSLQTVRTPKTVLEEQANILTEATGGLLIGKVYDLAALPRTSNLREDELEAHGGFGYDLDVVVPALNNYRYTVLSIYHPLNLYPATLVTYQTVPGATLRSEAELEIAIEKVLSSPPIRLALSHLKSQVAKS